MPSALQRIEAFKLVGPAEKITTANRFSVLQGHAPDPPDPPDPPTPPGPPPPSIPAPVTRQPPKSHPGTPSPKTPRSPDPLTTSLPQINQLITAGHPLIKIAGLVAGQPAVALLDCGATGLFASSRFAQAHGLTVTSASSNTVTLPNGQTQPAGGVISSVPVSLGNYSERLDFTLTDLHGYDVILGMPWLVRYNPAIDWRGATVSFVDQHGHSQVLRRIANRSRAVAGSIVVLLVVVPLHAAIVVPAVVPSIVEPRAQPDHCQAARALIRRRV